MAHVADHLSVSALEQQYRSCTDVTAARHLQTIWLLAKGHEMAEVAATVSYAQRWVERLLARYNAQGPQALGDLRRRNGTSPTILKPDLLDKLKARLREPPPDGGLWTSPKVAAWMAGERGRAAVLPQRGWEALKAIGWSVQKPRPRHPAAATPEEREAFKKSWSRPSLRREPSTRTRRSKSGPRTNTASAYSRSCAGCGRPKASGRSRWVTTGTRGCTSPPSCSRSRARPSGPSRTGCPSRSLPRCWRCLRARPGRDGIASSCSGSTAPAGTPRPTGLCRMGSGASTCPRTHPSFSRLSTSGPSSTSHSPTNTSPRLLISSTSWPRAVAFSITISSNPAQTSTGGPGQTSRPNQPETVSQPKMLASNSEASTHQLTPDKGLVG